MRMSGATNFTNEFLIAMPALADPNFFRSVTLICDHNDQGALGIVINHPTELQLGELFDHLDIEAVDGTAREIPVFNGGPVQVERGFVLHELTTSKDILADIALGQGPRRVFVALGYAGWGSGQLEHEMSDNAWLTTPCDTRIVFDLPPEQRWREAAQQLGVDLDLLAGDAGHA
jgi:putative transcriptional regulator